MSQIDAENGDWLTVQETSALVKVAPQTLANWRVAGRGPRYSKISPGRAGRIRYRRADVLAFLNERQVAA